MKILVERDLMVEIATMLEQMIRKNPYNKNELQRRLNEIEEAFANNTEPRRGKCLVCGAKTNSAMSGIDINYCGPCWNSGKAKEHKEKEKEKPLTPITPEELMEIVRIGQKMHEDGIFNKPDPRCDGCEYQHPFRENMLIGGLDDIVYCQRGVNPRYYKDGKTIQYDPALKLCHRYEYNNALTPKSQTTEDDRPINNLAANPTNEACRLIDNEKCEACWGNHHNAIIEILDMLIEEAKYTLPISTATIRQAEALKAKLVNEK